VKGIYKEVVEEEKRIEKEKNGRLKENIGEIFKKSNKIVGEEDD